MDVFTPGAFVLVEHHRLRPSNLKQTTWVADRTLGRDGSPRNARALPVLKRRRRTIPNTHQDCMTYYDSFIPTTYEVLSGVILYMIPVPFVVIWDSCWNPKAQRVACRPIWALGGLDAPHHQHLRRKRERRIWRICQWCGSPTNASLGVKTQVESGWYLLGGTNNCTKSCF